MSKNPLKQYEEEINKLESIIQNLEDGDIRLEDALKQYEQGIALIRKCQQQLEYAEQKINILNEEKNTNHDETSQEKRKQRQPSPKNSDDNTFLDTDDNIPF